MGGLCCGVALKTLGHKCTILERNPTALLQNQGAGIVAGGDTLAFLQKYDRCKRPVAVQSQKRMYLDKSGQVVHEEVMEQNMTSWDLSYYLLRANFDGVKSDYCEVPPPQEGDGQVEYRYGHTVTDITDEESQVRVHFKIHEAGEGTMLADLVIGADGPSSSVRKLFLPDIQRNFTGYCALRGTVPELEVSPEAKEVFCERFTFFHAEGIQILAYLIPGVNGTVEPGKRLVNFVYYYNYPIDSKDFNELMTDVDGKRHNITMPPGKMQPEVWAKAVRVAKERLPPQFAEIIAKTKYPFVQAITDVISTQNSFMNGKVLLIGDAMAGFRPHTVASTSQAAFDAMVLTDYVRGKKSHDQFVRETMQFARLLQHRGVQMGERSQHSADAALEDHIFDRNVASTKREDEVYPDWVNKGLPVVEAAV